MPTYTVTEILGRREWGDGDKKVNYFDFKVQGDDRRCNVGRKPGNDLTIGEVLDGTFEPDDRGTLKFKKAFTGGGGGRPRDPKESAQIVRQHSQEMALRYAAIKADKELLPANFTLAQLALVIDWFEKDAKAATP